ncbi:MAG: DUF4374 domain-containing protein [Bacteroidales bacterium]|jgi:hypothetical protein|nr:DUF4374 domain-containing protein [Bacteroidales bacterium]
MNKKIIFPSVMIALGAMSILPSCDKDENKEQTKGAYLISASSEDGSYLLQSEELSSGQVSIAGNGIESASATTWIFYKNRYAYGLMYRQGDPATVSAYEINAADGKLTPRLNEYQMPSRFTTWGYYSDYIVTSVNATGSDNNTVITFNFLDVNNQTITEKAVPAGNLIGNGAAETLSGILEAGDRFFSGVCPTVASTAEGDALRYIDSVWVAIFDKDLNYTVLRDGRLSYATGRHRSSYRTNIAKDDNDNVYVFSSAYDSRTSKPSGALRVKKGETRFDPDYFFDIQSAAQGRHLFTVWHITGDYFLLQMYTTPNQTSEAVWSVLAVVDVAKKTYREVTGLPAPDKITSIGSTPCADGGKIAVPVVSSDEYPHIYIIDPATATASKGIEVIAESISAVGKLNY